MTERRPPPVSAVAVAPRCRHGYIEERSERNLQGISNRRPADQAVRHGTGRPQRSDPDGGGGALPATTSSRNATRPPVPLRRPRHPACGARHPPEEPHSFDTVGRRCGDGGGAAVARRQRSSASSKGPCLLYTSDAADDLLC